MFICFGFQEVKATYVEQIKDLNVSFERVSDLDGK